MNRVKVLFVCMGNICRSPTAEGVFRQLIKKHGLAESVSTDSAGTHAYHVGEPPDQRAQATAKNRGLDISDLRARSVADDDFDMFDYIMAMDADNYSNLLKHSSDIHHNKIALFLNYAPHLNLTEVPDPYYGGAKGFENVFDMVEAASEGLIAQIKMQKN